MSEAGVRASTPWRIARGLGVAATLALLVALVVTPAPALELLWGLIIPVVPASLLIAPHVWRSVCPLATLNMAANGLVARRTPGPRLEPIAAFAGVVLLLIMVPARRLVFNTNGPALAATVAGIAALAVALGAVFRAKSGFCNALCPVLPVERLYGQRPLVQLEGLRCTVCTACSGKECADLSPARAVERLVIIERQRRSWVASPFGAFTAAFPGFVLGYFLTDDGPLTAAPLVYGTVAASTLTSLVLVAALVHLGRVRVGLGAPLLAALAAAIYYWFAAPHIARTLGAPPLAGVALQAGLLALVAAWGARAVRA